MIITVLKKQYSPEPWWLVSRRSNTRKSIKISVKYFKEIEHFKNTDFQITPKDAIVDINIPEND